MTDVLATPANMKKAQDLGIRGLCIFDKATGQGYSATPGDYWDHPDNEPLHNDGGQPMVLARRVEKYELLQAEVDYGVG